MDGGVFHIIKGGIIYELEPEDEGGYVISVPALPGCISTGDTIEEALAMIAEAMELWLEVAREKGFPIPTQFDLLQQAS
jgi:predicted RNase H-like HicB family nuclease